LIGFNMIASGAHLLLGGLANLLRHLSSG